MSDLNLLISLQEYDYKLKDIKDELEELEGDLKVKKIKNELKSLDDRKIELSKETDKVLDELNILNRKLKDNYFNIEDIDKKLYNGDITDLKQLDQMNDEHIALKKETKTIEDNTLIVMESQEILGNEMSTVNRRVEELNVEIDKMRESNIEKIDEYNKKIEKLSIEREKILESLDEKYISDYKNISPSKINFIVEVKDDKCMGCNMMLPIYIVNKVGDKELVRCENCNRLLYRKD